MSNETTSHLHILPLKIYLLIGGALLVLTGVTVFVASLDFGAMNLLVALGIAAFKATLVALYFMHLKYDNKFYSVIFLSSIVFLTCFIVLTMFDTMRRDDLNPERSQHKKPSSFIYDDLDKAGAATSPDAYGSGEAVQATDSNSDDTKAEENNSDGSETE